ncbi:MAG: hypothetical protein K2Q07_05655 [Burkholderiaceae bacterium]|nr:hypothetical protein [Burkholderiaceae bacterium]
MTDSERLAAAGVATPPSSGGLLALTREWLATWREIASVRFAILLEEGRGAVRDTVWLLSGAVLAALLFAWTWLLLLGLLATWLVHEGLDWPATGLALLAANVLALAALAWWLRRGVAALGLPHTAAALAGRPAPPATDP